MTPDPVQRAAILVGALLFLATSALANDVYRWVDADGRVHFSDRPPVDQPAERVGINNRPTDLEATLREQTERERRLELAQQLRADAAEDAAAEAEYAARLAHSCAQARERVTRIEQARRLTRVGDDGVRRDYDEAERAAALAEARAQVQEWCR